MNNPTPPTTTTRKIKRKMLAESQRELVCAAREAVELTRGMVGLDPEEYERLQRARDGLIKALAALDYLQRCPTSPE